jgi:type VI secretion system protein ImpL
MIAYLVTAVILILYLVFTWFLGGMLGLKSPDIWILRGGLALIGIAVAAIFVWYWAKKQQQKKLQAMTAPTGGDELDTLLGEAETKLGSSRLVPGANFGALPVIFLVGPAGGTKTSTMVNSGLEPELLAGQIFQDTAVVPTRSANLWFAQQSIFVEASGRLIGDAPSWTRLIRRMQARRFGSVFGKGQEAPRAAVVCLPCDIFLKPGAAENVPAAARNLAGRLGEVSQLLGINLPVYVLFTKLDRLSFFHEYVRNLTDSEATQVLGATLAAAPVLATGVYAEQESARLTKAFSELFYSLADKRTAMLSRENEPEKLPGIYEFPREFRKLRTLATQFLVDLCRPSQLSTGPFLRGFYFCGVRPVLVRDVATSAAAQPAFSQASRPKGDATGMFRIESFEQAQAPAVAPVPVATTRKVPQWVFLNHFFVNVLLKDRAWLGAGGASVKTNLWRRVGLATVAAICLLFCVAFTISHSGNHEIAHQAGEATAGIGAAPAGNVVSTDALNHLESVRQLLETLTRYEREGPPLHLRWGLYIGHKIYPDVRRLYFNRLYQLLFSQTQAGLLATLKGLPAAPGPSDDYGYTYDTLKAYLMTTSNHDKATQPFLGPLLTNRWATARAADPEQTRLARRQFDFYSQELAIENPYSASNDAASVEKARVYLSLFAGAERVYQVMVAEANKSNPSVNFNRKFPGSAEVVVNDRDVAGAYTKAGWTFMQNAIKNAESFFTREQWVLGAHTASGGDRAKLEQDLRTRYYADFVNQWRDYFKKSAVVRYADFKDASRKLTKLDGPQSPLLALFWLASQNTGVDAPDVVKKFKAVHAVVPPTSVDQYIGPANTDYMKALIALQVGIDQIANLPPAQAEQGGDQARSAAGAAKLVTGQMALTFGVDPEAHLEATVLKLLEDPITNVVGAIPAPPAPGQGLCAEFKPLFTRYPFSPKGPKATIDEIGAFFAPQKGTLWTFYDQKLKKFLTPQGVPIPGSTPPVPRGIAQFFSRAAAFSNALYPGGAAAPHLVYALKPELTADVPGLRLEIDGQPGDFATSGAPAKQYFWPGASAHEVRAVIKIKGGSELPYTNYDGLWAIFEFIDEAEKYQPTPVGASIDLVVRAGPRINGQVRLDLDMLGAPNVFRKGYFSSLACSESAK